MGGNGHLFFSPSKGTALINSRVVIVFHIFHKFNIFPFFLLTNMYMSPSSGMGGMDFGRNDMQMNQGFGNSFGAMGEY